MATTADVKYAFDIWNCIRVGRDRGVSGNWTYRDTVMCYQDRPYQRFFTGANKEPVKLYTGGNSRTGLSPNPATYDYSKGYGKRYPDEVIYKTWCVPHIGAHSRFPGDMLSDAETHELNRSYFQQELAQYIEERLVGVSAPELHSSLSQTIGHVDKMYTRHHNYSVLFGLHWQPLPKFYRDQIIEHIQQKFSDYMEPAKARARERAAAKKTAKKAFGLD